MPCIIRVSMQQDRAVCSRRSGHAASSVQRVAQLCMAISVPACQGTPCRGHLFGQRWVQYCGNLCAKVAAEHFCLAVGNVGWNGIEWRRVQVASQILALTLNSYWPWHSIWQQQFICSILNNWKTPVWPLAHIYNFSLVLIATNELFHYWKTTLSSLTLFCYYAKH